MHITGVLAGSEEMEFSQVPDDTFRKLLDIKDESSGSLAIMFSSPQSRCEEQNEEFGTSPNGVIKSDSEFETQQEAIIFQGTQTVHQTVQGPVNVYFTGTLEGIACQVMVEHGAVWCRIRSMAEPVRSRIKRLRGQLARELSERGMTLDRFQVTP